MRKCPLSITPCLASCRYYKEGDILEDDICTWWSSHKPDTDTVRRGEGGYVLAVESAWERAIRHMKSRAIANRARR